VNTPTGEAINLNEVNVSFTPDEGESATIPKDDTDCLTEADGWQYTNAFEQIQLCGDACQKVQADGQLDVVIGCQTVLRAR